MELTVDNFANNGDKQPKTVLGSYGVYMGTKKYNDGNNIKMPEGINFINCKFVRQDVGVHALGLFVQFLNTEFDYSSKFGGFYAGGDKVDFINCYVASQSARDNDFVAFMVQAYAPQTPEPVSIINCTINMQKNSIKDKKSFGIKLSGGAITLNAARVENCFFRGDGYNSCIFIEKSNAVIIRGNTFRVSGQNINIVSVKNMTLCDNFGLGEFVLPQPDGTECWIITGNTGNFAKVDLTKAKNSLIVNQSLSANHIY
ncbi:hypothetical protein ABK905_17835 [Acerihabitans sp. KWT182]|uniref:Right handed beta helix domain-containing protein n=1 Tax=Acerihabitans sp. KWT182 TaxID=3157919 RepID=A0AAU7Q8J4_9GAMM